MIRIVGMMAVMTACGIVNLFGAVITLMNLGYSRFGNYDYYGNRLALFLGPALIGFLAPGILGWYLDRRRALRFPLLLGLMLVCGVVIAFIWAFILNHAGL